MVILAERVTGPGMNRRALSIESIVTSIGSQRASTKSALPRSALPDRVTMVNG